MQEVSTPPYLYKIVSTQQWEKSKELGYILPAPTDAECIHLATQDQLPHVLEKYWNEQEYLILKVETKSLTGNLIYETNPGGQTKYYHLYQGMIPLDSVAEILVSTTDPNYSALLASQFPPK
ncbi:MAG: DUF952 domain-containing protein [Verrucomicrobia bacterium]|nr:DUF952 domain-containing protein [Verrucomicrobiota bacterium]